MKTVAHAITSVFWIGHLRPGPGTWGALVALFAAAGLHVLGGPALLGLLLGVALLLGWWAVGVDTRGKAEKDPAEIVIDEVVGQWIAFLPVSIGAAHVGGPITALWPGWLTAFVLFRLLDVFKPGPIGWADRQGGTTGVMLDDILAGVFAGFGVVVLAALSHGVLGL